MSGVVNKIKDALHSDKSNNSSSHSSAPEGTSGPHNSRVANAADPRVDSDRDHSHTVGGAGTTTGRTAGHGEYGSGNPFSSTTGTHTGAGAANPFSSSGGTEGAHGPHSSRVANAADPRIDSDRDGSRTMGGSGGNTFGSNTAGGGLGGLGGAGIGGGGHGGSNTLGSSNNNPLSSGMTGTHGAPAGTHGPHGSRVANAADPRVDSDRDGRGALGSSGPGPASNTAGPHKSDMLNKLDPRVDSDLDHSKTVGGDKTFQ